MLLNNNRNSVPHLQSKRTSTDGGQSSLPRLQGSQINAEFRVAGQWLCP